MANGFCVIQVFGSFDSNFSWWPLRSHSIMSVSVPPSLFLSFSLSLSRSWRFFRVAWNAKMTILMQFQYSIRMGAIVECICSTYLHIIHPGFRNTSVTHREWKRQTQREKSPQRLSLDCGHVFCMWGGLCYMCESFAYAYAIDTHTQKNTLAIW